MEYLNFDLTKIFVDRLGYDEEYPGYVWVKAEDKDAELHNSSVLEHLHRFPFAVETYPAITLADAMWWINEMANEVYVWFEVEHNGVKPFFVGYLGTPHPNERVRESSQKEVEEAIIKKAVKKILENRCRWYEENNLTNEANTLKDKIENYVQNKIL